MATFRDGLIRAHFEAHRDLTWVEKVEPQLRDRGLDAASISSYRQAWNEHMKKKDCAALPCATTPNPFFS